MKNKTVLLLSILLFGVFAFYSCDTPVSLGAKLNLDPPVINIESPDFMENIGETLIISGTATDLQEVVLINITVERISNTGEAWIQQWRGEQNSARNGGIWRARSSENSSWDYVSESENVKWEVNNQGNVNWSIELLMKDAPNGEYLITAGSVNNVRNEGALSQRRVIIDTASPVVKILTPSMDFDDDDDNTYTFNDHVYPAFIQYQLRDASVLEKLHNKRIRVQYEIEDEFSVEFLAFQLADHLGNIFYNSDLNPVANLNWSGRFDIPAAEIRNENGQINERTFMQLISVARDRSGNERKRSHGWLIWWPEADKPWVDGVGHESDPQQFRVFPGSEIQGQAFDNDGVASVSYRIFRGNELIAEGNKPLDDNTPLSTFFIWSFTAPIESDIYRIEIDCKDIHGTSGDTLTKYFFVFDVNAPNVTVSTPNANQTMFGNNAGEVLFTGIADDGSEVTGLTIVWLNPAGNSESRLLYMSADYEGWSIINTTASGKDTAGDDYWLDDPVNGNKIWKAALDSTNNWNAVNRRWEKQYSKSINIFNDLNIGIGSGKLPLNPQSFILRVENASGRSLTRLHSVRGDLTPPSLGLTKIEVRRAGSDTLIYTINDNGILDGNSIGRLEATDEIYLIGEWNDDSFTVWNNLDLMGKFETSWITNTDDGIITFNPTGNELKQDGTFAAGPFLLGAESASPSARINMRLTDIANNVRERTYSFRVDTNIPHLMFISAENADGTFNAGKTIDIELHFNKPVTFSGGTDDPTLTLNSSSTNLAVYQSGNGTERHVFRYTVAAGEHLEEGERLDVVSINRNNNTYSGEGGAVILDINDNLANNRNLRIDTIAPRIDRIESMSETGHYNHTRSINILVTFDEDITFNPGSGTFLGLNSGATATAGNPAAVGSKSIMFSYSIEQGETAEILAVNAFNLGTSIITDIAGNQITANPSIPAAGNISHNGRTIITIDTTPPPAPELKNTTTGTETALVAGTYTTAQRFIITCEIEDEATIEYQIAADGNWLPYSEEVILDSAGDYQIRARQTDRAGNTTIEANYAGPVNITIEVHPPLLQSITANAPGTFGAGTEIEIYLNLREPVIVEGSPTLTLNTVGRADVSFISGSGTNRLVFKYVIRKEDSIAGNGLLEIDTINLAGVNISRQSAAGVNLTPELPLTADSDDPAGWGKQGLGFYTPIRINTAAPLLQEVSFNGNDLTLRFDREIFKGTGMITIKHINNDINPYLAPAVITPIQFNNFGGAANIGDFYTSGIEVCDEWKNDFIAFRNRAINNGYSENLSIDRIDSNGNYCPENCRWATHDEQNKNRRSNIYIEHDGKKICLKDYCKLIGISYSTVQGRRKRGIKKGDTNIFKKPHPYRCENKQERG